MHDMDVGPTTIFYIVLRVLKNENLQCFSSWWNYVAMKMVKELILYHCHVCGYNIRSYHKRIIVHLIFQISIS